MSTIITSDWHLTDRPRDEYRWGIFQWLAEQSADELIICGDLCDQKDRHNAVFVNRLYNQMVALSNNKYRIIILKGNHDYIDPNHPFFGFLGDVSDSVFITYPTTLKLSIGSAFFVPADSKWDFKIPKVNYLFAHATFTGAESENGTRLTGVNPALVEGFEGRVISGDIHVPQKIHRGLIEYIGAPYHTRFGDSFNPRLMWIGNDGITSDLYFPAPKKHTFIITEPDQLHNEKASKGDQVKIRCLLYRAQYDLWPGYRQTIQEIAENREWVLCGVEPSILEATTTREPETHLEQVSFGDAVVDYAERQKAGKSYLDIGLELLKSAEGI